MYCLSSGKDLHYVEALEQFLYKLDMKRVVNGNKPMQKKCPTASLWLGFSPLVFSIKNGETQFVYFLPPVYSAVVLQKLEFMLQEQMKKHK